MAKIKNKLTEFRKFGPACARSVTAALQEVNLRVATPEAQLATMWGGSSRADRRSRRRRPRRRRRSSLSSSESLSSSVEDSSRLASSSWSSSSLDSEPERRRKGGKAGGRRGRAVRAFLWRLTSYKKQYGLTRKVCSSIGKALKTKLLVNRQGTQDEIARQSERR